MVGPVSPPPLLNGTSPSPLSHRRRHLLSPLYRWPLSVVFSLLFLYHAPLQWRHAALSSKIRYPVQDPELLTMAAEDLYAWSSRDDRPSDGSPGETPTYVVPDPAALSAINPYLAVIRFSTRGTKNGIEVLNGRSFDHLRMLWFGCSLHRMLRFARARNLDIDTVFVLNVGDDWVEGPTFPIWSKGRRAAPDEEVTAASTGREPRNSNGTSGRSSSSRRRLDIMIPYEELLWTYRPRLMSLAPFWSKSRRVVFRGGCTHPHRRRMVEEVRRGLDPDQFDVQVGCEPGYRPLTSHQQATYRCLLDYDGNSYSRRTAWYLETASVVLRGGVIDDVISRLGRRRQKQQQQQQQHGRQEEDQPPADELPSRALPPPIVFWRDDELLTAVKRCISDDEWSERQSRSVAKFWRQYVRDGQALWEGYMLHLLVEQSKRFAMVFPHEDTASDLSSSIPIFTKLSSTMVCPLIQDGATPTGEFGELQWCFILSATLATLFVSFVTYRWVVPLFLCQIVCLLRKGAVKTTNAGFALGMAFHDPQFRVHSEPLHRSHPAPVAAKPSPTRSIMQFLVQRSWIRAPNPTHEREE